MLQRLVLSVRADRPGTDHASARLAIGIAGLTATIFAVQLLRLFLGDLS